MPTLPDECVPCKGDTPTLTRAEVEERLDLIPHWSLSHPRISRSFELRDFRKALAWANRVGMLAEEQGHHPDIHITNWNRVELVLWTHAVGGLTENDFVMARKIDELAAKDR